jgi:Arc/MetJ-type ribon-helix-helix transcriptional regulator
MGGSSVMEKVTVSLPGDLLHDLRRAVSAGEYSSQNAAIRQALRRELRRNRDEQLEREFTEAMQDPRFVREVDQIMEEFAAADAETARMLPDE